jgi:flagellar basal body-associated protein FliL
LSFNDILEIASRVIWKIKNHKRVLICIFLLIVIFVMAVGAVVYNYMSMTSSVGVKVVTAYNC